MEEERKGRFKLLGIVRLRYNTIVIINKIGTFTLDTDSLMIKLFK